MNNIFSDLKNKTIVITGGSGFLGSQFVEAFLQFHCNVVVLDLKKNNLSSVIKTKSKNYFYLKCDITNEKKLKVCLNKIITKFKTIDVLINNAFNDYVPKKSKKISFALEEFDHKIWSKDLNVGLKGAFLCTKIFGSFMKRKKRGGNIINISSDLGIISPDQRVYKKMNFVKPITYSVIKHGIIGLTKYTATYWAENKIRCNAIAPGGMFNNQDKNFLNEISKLIPLKRLGRKNEYNSLLLFLASDQSSYITGSTVVIDGGRSIL